MDHNLFTRSLRAVGLFLVQAITNSAAMSVLECLGE
jgi:hypothetical protein